MFQIHIKKIRHWIVAHTTVATETVGRKYSTDESFTFRRQYKTREAAEQALPYVKARHAGDEFTIIEK